MVASKTIVNLLEQPQYLGHTVNFRTTKKSYKSKKKILNSEDKWVIFEHTHEALITQEQWDIVQKNRQQRPQTDAHGRYGNVLWTAVLCRLRSCDEFESLKILEKAVRELYLRRI